MSSIAHPVCPGRPRAARQPFLRERAAREEGPRCPFFIKIQMTRFRGANRGVTRDVGGSAWWYFEYRRDRPPKLPKTFARRDSRDRRMGRDQRNPSSRTIRLSEQVSVGPGSEAVARGTRSNPTCLTKLEDSGATRSRRRYHGTGCASSMQGMTARSDERKPAGSYPRASARGATSRADPLWIRYAGRGRRWR